MRVFHVRLQSGSDRITRFSWFDCTLHQFHAILNLQKIIFFICHHALFSWHMQSRCAVYNILICTPGYFIVVYVANFSRKCLVSKYLYILYKKDIKLDMFSYPLAVLWRHRLTIGPAMNARFYICEIVSLYAPPERLKGSLTLGQFSKHYIDLVDIKLMRFD